MEEFISEPITPLGGFDTAAMASGLPGLPRGFTWRAQEYTVVAPLETWKVSAAEGGRPGGERYLRRHYSRLRMSDGAVWTVYFTRQAARGGGRARRRGGPPDDAPDAGHSAVEPAGARPARMATTRWFLYSRTAACDDSGGTGPADPSGEAPDAGATTGRGTGPNE
jgi:hypothetical protein